jgi:outer membrane protein assembly factor BamA
VLGNGLVKSGQTGGHGWNPFATGRTYLTLTPFIDYLTIQHPHSHQHINENGLRFGVVYDNVDFPLNPSSGNVTRLVVSRDFGVFDTSNPWTNVSAEFSQYVDLGRSRIFRQQVAAVNLWTSYSPTWSQVNSGGRRQVFDAPPFYDGATLGGNTRFRGYADNRFWDRAAVYADAELRLTPVWNPFDSIGILKKADLTWMQFVIFGEIGRVGPNYSGKLLSHLKGDAGFGIRLLANDTIVRFDVAASNEHFGIWAGLNQPF